MKRKGLLLLALLYGFILGAQETGSIDGVVRLAENGNRLDMVALILEKTTQGATTDGDGYYRIDQVPPGEYILIASDIGLEQVRKNVTVKAGETTTVNFDLDWALAELGEIVIKGEVIREKNKSVPVNAITLSKIKSMNISKPDELLNYIPGVVLGAEGKNGGMSDGFVIRGYGMEAMQAAVNLDGIPLNEYAGHGLDGQVDMFVIIPLELKQMNVYKGPTSVLFGRFAKGGAVSFETRRGGEYMDFSLTGGAFSTADFQAAIGKPIQLNNGKELKTNIAAQIYSTDGYTENGQIVRGNLSTKFTYDLTDRTDVSLSLRGHSSRWNTDSYVFEDQFHDKRLRRLPFQFTEDDGGDKMFASERIDVNHTINENIRLLSFANTLHEKGTRFFTRSFRGGGRPGEQSEEFNKRNAFLAGSSLNGKSILGSSELNWVLGGEYYFTRSERRIWETTFRQRDEETRNNKATHNTVSLFAEGVWEVSRYFRPSIGFRYDSFFVKFYDLLSNQSYELNYFDHVSPKLGISSNLFDDFTLRVNVSNGFDIPTSSGLPVYLASDEKVEPVKVWQYELGGNYKYGGIFSIDVSAFILDESNFAYEDANGNFFNAGKIRRSGIEIGTEINPVPRLQISGTFAYLDTEIKDNPDQPDLVGKEVSLVPHTISTFIVDYQLKEGPGIRFDLSDVGKYALEDPAHSKFYNGYTVANTEFYYSFGKENKNSRLFLQVNNIFDKIYSTRAINFGTEKNFYAPAPTRHLVAGIKYNF